MANVSHPDSRDPNRPFSGPLLPSGSDGGVGESGSVVAPLIDQLRLLKNSSPDEFQRLYEGVMDASEETRPRASDLGDVNVTTDVEDTSASVSDDDGSEMDVTSDGGSTVRETNEQENDDDQGNTGKSGNTGIPGTSWERGNVMIAGEGNTGDWSTVTQRKRKSSKSANGSSSSAGSNVGTNKKTCTVASSQHRDQGSAPVSNTGANLVVFVAGVGFDISVEATKQPIAFQRNLVKCFGAVGPVKLLKGSIRITCRSERQRVQLLSSTDFDGKTIDVSEPRQKYVHQAKSVGSSNRSARGIIFGVSSELSEDEIRDEVGAVNARRLTKFVDGARQPTESVVLTFDDVELPDAVCIGFLRRKVKQYVPLPMRCNKCQSFGHRADHCKHQAKCVRCGQSHSFESCPVKDDVAQAMCANCKGNHSAAFRGCPKYQQVSETLKVAAVNKISYRDALVKVKSNAAAVADVVVADDEELRPRATSTPAPKEQRQPRVRHRATAAVKTGPATSHQTTTTDKPRAQSAGPATPTNVEVRHHTDWKTRAFHRRILVAIITLCDVITGDKQEDAVRSLRKQLYNSAGYIFGSCNGRTPCFDEDCHSTHTNC